MPSTTWAGQPDQHQRKLALNQQIDEEFHSDRLGVVDKARLKRNVRVQVKLWNPWINHEVRESKILKTSRSKKWTPGCLDQSTRQRRTTPRGSWDSSRTQQGTICCRRSLTSEEAGESLPELCPVVGLSIIEETGAVCPDKGEDEVGLVQLLSRTTFFYWSKTSSKNLRWVKRDVCWHHQTLQNATEDLQCFDRPIVDLLFSKLKNEIMMSKSICMINIRW